MTLSPPLPYANATVVYVVSYHFSIHCIVRQSMLYCSSPTTLGVKR